MRHTVTARIAAVLAGALILAGCGGAETRLETHMERGREYFTAENYDKARVEFRNALQVAPDDAEVRFMNARVAEKLGNIADAARLYQSALDANADHVQARAALGRMFVFGGVPERAKETVAPGLEKHPNDADLLTVRGAARIQLKDRAGALADAESAVKIAPDNESAVALLAALYQQTGEGKRAADLISSTLERVPSSVELRQVLASLYSNMGEPQLAEEQLRKIIELKPKDLRHRQLLALSYVRAKEIDKGEQVLREALTALPDDNQAKLSYAEFLASQRSPERGVEAMKEFISRDPKNFELQFGLGAMQLRNDRPEEATATYTKILDADGTGPQGLQARNRIATVHLSAKRYEEASKLIAEVLKENPQDQDALILRGNLAMERNDPVSAIADLRAVLRDQPRAVGLLRTLARAHLANGESTLAEETLRNALDAAPADMNVRLELGQLLTQNGRAGQAVPMLEETVNGAPENVQAREALVRAYIATKDLDAARRGSEDLKLTAPTLATGPYLAALVAQAQGRLDDAQRELEKALQLQPTAIDALTALTRLDVQRNRTGAAVARLQSAIEANSRNIVARNMLAELYLATKEPAKSLEQSSQVLALAPKWWIPHRNFALAKLASGDRAGAAAALEAGVKATDYQAALATDLASLYERMNRGEDAIRQYEELHKRNPRSEMAANNLAMLLITYRKDQASLDRARDLTAPFATSSVGAYLDTHGWVRFKRGEFSQALPVLERAAAEAPDSKIVQFHLGMAQSKAGDREKAITTLEKALDGNAQFAGSEEARSTLAELKGSSAVKGSGAG